MKVEPGNGRLDMDVENNIRKLVHHQFVDDGSRMGRAVWQIIFSGSTGTNYQFATTNYYADFSKLGFADIKGAFASIHPGKFNDKLLKETDNSRELMKAALWRVVNIIP